MKNGRKRIDYKWIVFGLCFLMVFIALGFCSSNKGLYLDKITEALNIKRSLFAINDSFRFLSSAIVNLFFGALIARFGARCMIGFGFASLTAAMLTYAYAENIFVFYLGGMLLGIGFTFTSSAMAGSIIKKWFKKNIGRYTGIVYSANGIGGAVSAQIINPIINREGDPFAYRDSYLLIAGILIVFGTIIVLFIKGKPDGYEEKAVPEAEAAPANQKSREKGSRANLLLQPYFYFIIITVFLTGFMLQGMTGVYAAHMKGVGLSVGFVGLVASIGSLLLTASKIFVGIIYDKFGLPLVMIVCQSSAVFAMLTLSALNASGSGQVLAIIFTVFNAIALPLETLVVPLIVNKMFEGENYDKMLGIAIAANYAGYAAGAPVINIFYDSFGSYNLAFIIYAALMVLCSVLFFISYFLKRGSEKTSKCSAKN